MNKYCHLIDNIVTTIENEYIDIFPNIPIQERYTKEFLDNCIVVDESVNVEVGWEYIDGKFVEPIPVVNIPEVVVEEPDPEKVEMAETIIMLSNQLATEGGV